MPKKRAIEHPAPRQSSANNYSTSSLSATTKHGFSIKYVRPAFALLVAGLASASLAHHVSLGRHQDIPLKTTSEPARNRDIVLSVPPAIASQVAQAGSSSTCVTPTLTCSLNARKPIGSTCYCTTSDGVEKGSVR